MVGNRLHPSNRRVKQVGLTSTSDAEVKALAHRVAQFNQRYSTSIVLDINADHKNEIYHLVFDFDSYEVQEKFWLE